MCINPLPITNLLTNVLRAPGSTSAMTSTRPSTLKAHEVALRNKKGREVLMMDLKVQRPAQGGLARSACAVSDLFQTFSGSAHSKKQDRIGRCAGYPVRHTVSSDGCMLVIHLCSVTAWV